MSEHSAKLAASVVAENLNLVKGDLRSSIAPPLIGIPAGFIASYLNHTYPDRGYLSSEYYVGTAFELQLVVLISFLFCFPLIKVESLRHNISFNDLCLGLIFCNIICFLMAYGHGYFPLLLFYFLQWLWICYFWQKKLIPAFRYAIWLFLGVLCGAITGTIVAFSMF